MTDQLLCATCGRPVHRSLSGTVHHFGYDDHPATLMPFPPGSKALYGRREDEVTILAADGVMRWAKWPDGGAYTVGIDTLRPIPTKIPEPPVGSVVWDGDVPWIEVGHGDCWLAWVNGTRRRRFWSDMPDTVVLATPPGSAS